jgi:hypothetical protein
MTEAAIRAAIDAAIRSHLERRRGAPPPRAAAAGNDASHAQVADNRLSGDPPPGRCVIEPSVDCVHCGYCRSQGY